MKAKRLVSASISLVFLAIGLVSYYISNRTILHLEPISSYSLSQILSGINPFLLRVLNGYVADLCWSAAFPLALQSFLCLKGKHQLWLLLSVLLGVIYEFLQMKGVCPGTSDPLDVLVYILGTLISLVLIHIIWRET